MLGVDFYVYFSTSRRSCHRPWYHRGLEACEKPMRVFARVPVDLEEVLIPRGQVYIIRERCKECKICIEFCPKKILQNSTAINSKGYHYPEVIPGMENACVHCEFCTMVCPEFAIFTVEVLA